MLSCPHDVDMFTWGRIVLSSPKRAHVDWNWPISREKNLKIDWSVKMAYYGSCRLLMMGSCLRKQLPVFCSFRPDSEADKKLLFSSGFQLYFTGATENYSGAFRPQMYLCNYWESSAKSCGYPPPTGWLFLVYPEDETLCVINQFRNTVRKPKSFEAIEVLITS